MAKLVFGQRRPNVGKGILAGMVGGLVASWVMSQFHALLKKGEQLVEKQASSEPAEQYGQGQVATGSGRPVEQVRSIARGQRPQGQPQRQSQQEGEVDSTVLTAQALARVLLRRELTEEEKKLGGNVVHYGFGAKVGAVYGALAEVASVNAGFGLPFGAAVWLGAHEIVVPALGLSKSPAEYPLKDHAAELAAHLVYGATTEAVRRAVRKLI